MKQNEKLTVGRKLAVGLKSGFYRAFSQSKHLFAIQHIHTSSSSTQMRAAAVALAVALLLATAAAATSPSSLQQQPTTLIFGADIASECSAKCVLAVQATRPKGLGAALAVDQAPLRPWNTLTVVPDIDITYKARISCPEGCWAAAATVPVPLWPPPAAAGDANASAGPLTYTLLSQGSSTGDKLPRVYRIDLKDGTAEGRLLTVRRAARPVCDAVCAHRAALIAVALAWVVLCPALGWLVGGLWARPRSGSA
jgi:hypothetical protein